jgi:hypothetical protein
MVKMVVEDYSVSLILFIPQRLGVLGQCSLVGAQRH